MAIDLEAEAAALATSRARVAKFAIIVYILGTLTWRSRNASALQDTPVDSAAAVRLVADGLSAGLVILTLITSPIGTKLAGQRGQPAPTRVGGGPIILYWGYVFVVILGILTAVDPQLVAFRAVDLAACLIVTYGCVRWLPFDEAATTLHRVLLGMAASIVVTACARPAAGFVPAHGGVVPFRLEGVFPEFSANSVGLVGLTLFTFALAGVGRRNLGLGLGFALIALSQYRTGYIAIAICLGVYLLTAHGVSKRLWFALAVPASWWVYNSAYFQNALTRGESASNSVATLSGRTVWWHYAFEVAARSPWIGTGLTSGTRYEVLAAKVGNDDASTIHGTWIEAYVGAGVIGTAFLACFVVWALCAGLAWRSWTILPIMLAASTLMRSLTGTSIELANWPLLIFLIVCLTAREQRLQQPAPQATPQVTPRSAVPAHR